MEKSINEYLESLVEEKKEEYKKSCLKSPEPVPLFITDCLFCNFIHPFDGTYHCDAFPIEIPEIFITGKEKHDTPRPDLGQKNDIISIKKE